jgi:restriction system protein
MTIKEAILEVMREKGEPMSAGEAYDRIMSRGLYDFGAADPRGVVRFTIRCQCEGIDWKSSKSTKSFRLLDGGLYEPLKDSVSSRQTEVVEPESGEDTVREQLASLGREHEEQFIEEVIDALKQMTPEAFEDFSRDLLEAYGLEAVEVTSKGADGGIDGYAKLPAGLTTLNVSFQCKRWKGSVGSPEIDRFRGAMDGKNLHQGIILTTSYFTKEAKKVAARENAKPIILLGGREIVQLMIEKEFKVCVKSLNLFESDLSS